MASVLQYAKCCILSLSCTVHSKLISCKLTAWAVCKLLKVGKGWCRVGKGWCRVHERSASSAISPSCAACCPDLALTASGDSLAMHVQALYTLEVEVSVPGLGCSDRRSLRCGIRIIHSVVDLRLQDHVFFVNRQKVSMRCLCPHQPEMQSMRASAAGAGSLHSNEFIKVPVQDTGHRLLHDLCFSLPGIH